VIKVFEEEGIFQNPPVTRGNEIWVSFDVGEQSSCVDGPLAKAYFDIEVARIDSGSNPSPLEPLIE
jgi:hypothetical protein